MLDALQAIAVGSVSQGVNRPTFYFLNALHACVVLALLFVLAVSWTHFPALILHAVALLALTLLEWAALVWLICSVGMVDEAKQREELFGSDSTESKSQNITKAQSDAPTASKQKQR